MAECFAAQQIRNFLCRTTMKHYLENANGQIKVSVASYGLLTSVGCDEWLSSHLHAIPGSILKLASLTFVYQQLRLPRTTFHAILSSPSFKYLDLMLAQTSTQNVPSPCSSYQGPATAVLRC